MDFTCLANETLQLDQLTQLIIKSEPPSPQAGTLPTSPAAGTLPTASGTIPNQKRTIVISKNGTATSLLNETNGVPVTQVLQSKVKIQPKPLGGIVSPKPGSTPGKLA